MKITKVVIRKVAVPMVTSFETSFGTISDKETVLTELHTDEGLIGYGESSSFHSPVYNAETNDSCVYIQETFIAPAVIGKSFTTAQEFRDAYSSIVGNKIAQAGPESAFWHLLAQKQNKSLKELFGGKLSEIPVGESIGIKPSIQATLDEVAERLEQGFLRIKVKIKPGWDTEVLGAIRKKWPTIDLMADGNSAYVLGRDDETLKALDKFKLTMLEQPLAHDDIIDHATLQKRLKTPICLDESIESVEDARKAIEIGACKIINIKPGRVGGPIESMKIHDLCQKHGIGVWCGGLLETGIGRAFNIALASKAGYSLPADMSPYQFFYKEDLVEPSFVVKPNGHIDVSEEIGLGYAVRVARIEELTTKKVEINHVQK